MNLGKPTEHYPDARVKKARKRLELEIGSWIPTRSTEYGWPTGRLATDIRQNTTMEDVSVHELTATNASHDFYYRP